MLFPESFDIIMTVFGDNHRTSGCVVPDQNAEFLSVILQYFKVGLGEELVIKYSFIEDESITFHSPQFDLVGNSRRQSRKLFVAFWVSVLSQERDNLFGRNATFQRLTYTFTTDDTHH